MFPGFHRPVERGTQHDRGRGTVSYTHLDVYKRQEQAIRARMKELATQRAEKQPLEYPSAGSTFKRPEGYFAGKLIMDAGLRGYRVGGAQVSLSLIHI